MQDATFADTWVVLPTYDEIENLEGIAGAILERLPGATLLVVDDSSPDGTGELADRLAAADPRIRVRHRPGKEGLGKAYIDGFAVALEGGAKRIVQMDADWSHSPDYLPPLVNALAGGLNAPRPDGADLAIGSRYVAGGGVVDWDRVHSGGYVFQIETTYLASRAGARVVEVPIVFTDRRVGVSKMSRGIIGEALRVVLQLRWDEVRGRGPTAHLDRPAVPGA